MIALFSIVSVYLIGMIVLRLISREWSLSETLGFGFPVGMGCVTVWMFLMDVLGISLIRGTVLSGTFLLVAFLYFLLYYFKKDQDIFAPIKRYVRKGEISRLLHKQNAGVLFLSGVLIYLIYLVTVKALYWPAIHYDTIAGYDFLARAIAHEGTLHNSLFDPAHRLVSYRSIYPPLFPLSFAYAYICGEMSVKIIPILYYVSIAFSFYGLLRRYVNPLSSMLMVLILLATPEFAAQSTFLMTNMPQTIYTLIGVIGFICWFNHKGERYFALSIITLTLGVWGRTEGVVFFIPCCFALAYRLIRECRERSLFSRENVKRCLWFGIPSCVAYGTWEIYLKYVLKASDLQQPFKLGIIELKGKFDFMMRIVEEISFSSQLYGWVIYLGITAFVLNLIYLMYKREWLFFNGITLSLIVAAWCIYLWVYYQIDVPSLAIFEGYISYGYKRGLFNFLPLLLFYFATSKVVQNFSNMLYMEYPQKK